MPKNASEAWAKLGSQHSSDFHLSYTRMHAVFPEYIIYSNNQCHKNLVPLPERKHRPGGEEQYCRNRNTLHEKEKLKH